MGEIMQYVEDVYCFFESILLEIGEGVSRILVILLVPLWFIPYAIWRKKQNRKRDQEIAVISEKISNAISEFLRTGKDG